MKTKSPATKIRCSICKGTGINPSYNSQCGACFGTGLSTVSYDQPRNSTMIGQDTLAKKQNNNDDFKIEDSGTIINGKRVGILISWPNKQYEARLALDQQNKLY